MKVTNANKVKGCLLYNGRDYFFRVYDKIDKSIFKDYDIAHSDLNIIIDDNDACFYEYNDDNMRIDHHPNTLGHKIKVEK